MVVMLVLMVPGCGLALCLPLGQGISLNFIPLWNPLSTGTLDKSKTYGDLNSAHLEGQKGLLVRLQPFWPFGYFGHI